MAVARAIPARPEQSSKFNLPGREAGGGGQRAQFSPNLDKKSNSANLFPGASGVFSSDRRARFDPVADRPLGARYSASMISLQPLLPPHAPIPVIGGAPKCAAAPAR